MATAAVLATLAVGAAGGFVMASAMGSGSSSDTPTTAAATPAASSAALPTRPAMIGQVTRVVTGDEVSVKVASTDMTVKVLGVDTPDPASPASTRPAECGSREALDYADKKMTGQMVTLVPDPTLPELDDQGRRLAYVVLRSQLSYTDAAITDGIGRADTSRPLWYADVFTREQTKAVDDGRGMWGSPCNAKP